MNKKTSTAIALVLGLAAPFAFSGAAVAQVTFLVNFNDGASQLYSLSDAAALCGISEEAVSSAGECDANMDSTDADEFLAGEDDDDGPGSENSAAAFAPGQLKEEGESAREYAPGQQAQENGGSASDYAPGQQKKD